MSYRLKVHIERPEYNEQSDIQKAACDRVVKETKEGNSYDYELWQETEKKFRPTVTFTLCGSGYNYIPISLEDWTQEFVVEDIDSGVFHIDRCVGKERKPCEKCIKIRERMQ